ncbi:Retron-type RNA-directed DNA polymerase [hydrothermal vent metagenome]|uniref:Retron-type RNA-directed DNA polymerase n=1 Tax=hydrothermal vent metagenome TaxID=652676 RepID=A0A3B1DVM0_9ZZZZ
MTKQGGEIRSRWGWTEAPVWTNRMLAALENGVKGGNWFSLIDKVYLEANLIQSTHNKVVQNQGAAGVDHVTVEEFERHATTNQKRLRKELTFRRQF